MINNHPLPEFDVFKYQEDEYKIVILYLLKDVNQDIKETILNLVDINLDKEMNEEDIDYFGEIVSGEYDFSENYYDWFYDSDWYQSD